MTSKIFSVAARIVAFTTLSVIAACASGKSEPGAETPKKPVKVAKAGTETPKNARPQLIGLKACRKARDGRFHVTIGKARLALPTPLIQDLVPKSAAGTNMTKAQVAAALVKETKAGFGCPGKPMATSLAIMRGKFDDKLLSGAMTLVELPPGAYTKRFAAVSTRLQAKPGKNCERLGEAKLIGCLAGERRGKETLKVIYYITTAKSEKLRSGGPLYARCVLKGKKLTSCNIIDEFPGGLTVDIGLASGSYSTEKLRKALNLALKGIEVLHFAKK